MIDLLEDPQELSQDWFRRGRQGLTGADAGVSEGDKVDADGTRGVVTEVRTQPFSGPDGSDVDATPENPAIVVATTDGAMVARASDLTMTDWSTDQDDPIGDMADAVNAARADGATVQASVTDWDFPDSWEESDTPARLILLDAWASMGGQFDCGGGCCKGEMMASGMAEMAANRFCAAMKDRVLRWEGWRK